VGSIHHDERDCDEAAIGRRGNTKLVAQLNSPKSREQLQANLSTVVAQVQSARAEGKEPDEKKVVAISNALLEVSQNHPELPETWRAATELISYKSDKLRSIQGKLPPCDFKGVQPQMKQWTVGPEGGVNGTYGYAFYLSKCSLKLEDVPDLANKEADAPFKWVHMVDGIYRFPIFLTRGEVIYDGGPLNYDAGFAFINCTFDLHDDGVPSAGGQRILTAALKSEDLTRVDTMSKQESTANFTGE